MDLRVYYGKIREAMETIPGEFTIVVSRETPDGGVPGVMSETSKAVAAKMLVEGRARLATLEESNQHRQRERELREQAAQAAVPARLQVAVLSEKDLEAFKTGRTIKPSDGK